MNNMEAYISIAKEFSITPGARYYTDGEKSGEEFYATVLKDKFEKALENDGVLVIDLDGTEGYATSFLDEAFGNLSLKFGAHEVWTHIKLISNEEPYLIDQVKTYIMEAKSRAKTKRKKE